MMNESRSWRRILPVLSLLLVCACGVFAVADAQGIQQSPYSAADVVRRGAPGRGPDLIPSNPLGLPGSALGLPRGSDSLYISDAMLRGILPLIPNLQFGYLYDFGNNKVSSGRFTADYLLPFSLGADSMIFGEAHTEFQDFWKTNSFNSRVDMSFGGGYRTVVGHESLLGVNGYYDTSRLGGTWYSSGSVGLEMAALIGSDALDFNFNWYGQLFNSNVIRNAFRYGPSNLDFQAGYSHELWNGGPDLRLSATGYKLDIGEGAWGWNTGAELKTRDNVFILRYTVGHDKVDQTYQTVGGFVNVGFQFENLFRGENPFTNPEPVFKSPRNLRYLLTQPVKRDWHQPAAVVVARTTSTSASLSPGPPTPFIATAATGCIAPGSAPFLPLDPNAPFATVSGYSTLTITFTGAATDDAAVTLFSDSFDSPAFYPIPPGASSVTIPNSGVDARFFGGGGIVGTRYFIVALANNSSTETWCPGTVTLTWR